jgi:transcription antitermination factor NusG
MRRQIEIGKEVTICRGPLSGIRGTVIGLADNHRALVEVPLSRRPIVVELDLELLEIVSRAAG